MCLGSNENESCGWPKGTVRASIALTTIPIGFLTLTSVMILLFVREQYTPALGISNGLLAIMSAIVGYYFGSKQAEGAAKLVSDAKEDTIRSKEHEISMMNNIRSRSVRNLHDNTFDDELDVIVDVTPQ